MKVAFLSLIQYGYSAGHTELTRELASTGVDVYFLSPHFNERKNEPNVKQINIKARGSLRILSAGLTWLRMNLNRDDKLIVVHSNYSLLLFFSLRREFLLDVRTVSLSKHAVRRWIYNCQPKLLEKLGNEIMVLNTLMKKKLCLRNAHIVPLGADYRPTLTSTLRFDEIRCLYIGTFNYRELDALLIKLQAFSIATNRRVSIKLVGSGSLKENDKLESVIGRLNNNALFQAELLGYIHKDELGDQFGWANCGVAYLPHRSERFNVQPMTKYYEYVLAGLPVLLSETEANEEAFLEGTGQIIRGSSQQAFNLALTRLVEEFDSEKKEDLVERGRQFTWERIARNYPV